jgi:glutamine phosphoribosylpyrophosphate amidotransferase
MSEFQKQHDIVTGFIASSLNLTSWDVSANGTLVNAHNLRKLYESEGSLSLLKIDGHNLSVTVKQRYQIRNC